MKKVEGWLKKLSLLKSWVLWFAQLPILALLLWAQQNQIDAWYANRGPSLLPPYYAPAEDADIVFIPWIIFGVGGGFLYVAGKTVQGVWRIVHKPKNRVKRRRIGGREERETH